jgi:hypothetical protein
VFAGAAIFGFFAAMMVLQLLFVLFLMPETKGRSLESLEGLSRANTPDPAIRNLRIESHCNGPIRASQVCERGGVGHNYLFLTPSARPGWPLHVRKKQLSFVPMLCGLTHGYPISFQHAAAAGHWRGADRHSPSPCRRPRLNG